MLVVEHKSNGVAQDLSEQPASQVPEVLGPHPLYGVASRKLAEDGVDPVAKAAQEGAPFGSRIERLASVRRDEFDAYTLRQLSLHFRRPVIAVPDGDTAGGIQEFRYDRKLVGVRRGHREACDEPRPADPYVHPETVEGLLEKGVLAESGLPAEAPAAVSASEEARRQGHRVAQGEGGIVGGERKKLLPEALLDLPKVGCLSEEGGPMDLVEGGEPPSVVPAEEEVDALVGVYAEELSDYLEGENLRVRKLWRRAALTNAATLEPVVDKAEDGDDEGAKIHEKTSVTFSVVGLTPSVGRSSLWLKSSNKLAHGVS